VRIYLNLCGGWIDRWDLNNIQLICNTLCTKPTVILASLQRRMRFTEIRIACFSHQHVCNVSFHFGHSQKLIDTLMPPEAYYLGIDVGTGSARALLVKHDGTVVASSTHDTITYRDPHDHNIFEQSTSNIWSSIVAAVRDCLASSESGLGVVEGVGIDATCSLAVTDFEGRPVVVSKGPEMGELGERNVVLWADHRAEKEAGVINESGEAIVLDYVGGTMSVSLFQLRFVDID